MGDLRTRQGKLKIVAKTAGLMFEDEPDVWYNPDSESPELKQIVLSVKRGSTVELQVDDQRNFYDIKVIEHGVDNNNYQKSNSSVSDDHIVMLQGKKFITHAGLLDKAHKIGLKGISTEMVSSDGGFFVFKATVYIDNKGGNAKLFSAYGDAGPDSVGRNILPHALRMAETRAVNRALRFATNIGMTSTDEMNDMKGAKTVEPVISDNAKKEIVNDEISSDGQSDGTIPEENIGV